jgi:hypothetical protein
MIAKMRNKSQIMNLDYRCQSKMSQIHFFLMKKMMKTQRIHHRIQISSCPFVFRQ